MINILLPPNQFSALSTFKYTVPLLGRFKMHFLSTLLPVLVAQSTLVLATPLKIDLSLETTDDFAHENSHEAAVREYSTVVGTDPSEVAVSQPKYNDTAMYVLSNTPEVQAANSMRTGFSSGMTPTSRARRSATKPSKTSATTSPNPSSTMSYQQNSTIKSGTAFSSPKKHAMPLLDRRESTSFRLENTIGYFRRAWTSCRSSAGFMRKCQIHRLSYRMRV